MSTNNTFDSLTPQYAIPSEPQMHEMISDQTRVMHTVIEAEGAGGTWTLPLPKDFNFRKYFQWQQADNDLLQDKIYSGVAKGLDTIAKDGVEKFAKDTLQALGNSSPLEEASRLYNKSTTGEKIDAGLYLLQKVYGKDMVNQILYHGEQKKALNPLKKLYFQGMDLRTFDLNFDLIPQNSNESKKFMDNYLSFKKTATPVINANKPFYKYPPMFTVFISIDGRRLFYMNHLCCVNAGFNISDMRFRADGYPIAYSLNLTFQESELADQSREEANGLYV